MAEYSGARFRPASHGEGGPRPDRCELIVIRYGVPERSLRPPQPLQTAARRCHRRGQPARVTLRSRPDYPMNGAVVRIGLEADRVTEERRVYVRCHS